ncbi:hypothetical protein JHK87_016674 [Glycine soja]|nr:hypothetical protein JHK87_016674 [Glycine soja]
MASNGESDERPYRVQDGEQVMVCNTPGYGKVYPNSTLGRNVYSNTETRACISSASIIWVSPDTNTWVQNPYKSSNGELALDIILEEEAVKQSGDAWRIVIAENLSEEEIIGLKEMFKSMDTDNSGTITLKS